MLMDAGARADFVDEEGQTAMSMARKHGHRHIIHLLGRLESKEEDYQSVDNTKGTSETRRGIQLIPGFVDKPTTRGYGQRSSPMYEQRDSVPPDRSQRTHRSTTRNPADNNTSPQSPAAPLGRSSSPTSPPIPSEVYERERYNELVHDGGRRLYPIDFVGEVAKDPCDGPCSPWSAAVIFHLSGVGHMTYHSFTLPTVQL
ncbi:hypothetical protein QBC35DRAFT_468323 [Podospora australis]|uniref:Ankyrin repeat protein n=1 Tax=Podospora australis TaxID=1536484 RepID=A0AAN6WHV4_9PEZI|nr:hypothetical protein QBC35DRAFT_468323 [Podospora australis]